MWEVEHTHLLRVADICSQQIQLEKVQNFRFSPQALEDSHLLSQRVTPCASSQPTSPPLIFSEIAYPSLDLEQLREKKCYWFPAVRNHGETLTLSILAKEKKRFNTAPLLSVNALSGSFSKRSEPCNNQLLLTELQNTDIHIAVIFYNL